MTRLAPLLGSPTKFRSLTLKLFDKKREGSLCKGKRKPASVGEVGYAAGEF